MCVPRGTSGELDLKIAVASRREIAEAIELRGTEDPVQPLLVLHRRRATKDEQKDSEDEPGSQPGTD